MKVLHASHSFFDGGAARAAKRIHDGLRSVDVDSRIVGSDVGTDPLGIPSARFFGGARDLARQKLERAAVLLQRPSDSHLRSLALFPGPALRTIHREHADIVNLHLNYCGFLSVGQIAKISKPLVWTLHDMWALCGAEHYVDDANGCRWKEGYSSSNRAPHDRGIDLDRWTWMRKKECWSKQIQLVTPSNWLHQCVSQSELLHEWPVETIPYPIGESFKVSTEKSAARAALAVPEEVRVVIFGAAGATSDPRKGWDLLNRALPKAVERLGDLEIIMFGGGPQVDNLGPGIRVHWFGRLEDDALLARLYQASDVAIVPSRADNLPLVAMEAQTAGCQVCAFNIGGMRDLIDPEVGGYLANPFDVDDLAFGIHSCFSRNLDSGLRRRVQDRALGLWSPQVVASRYRDLYDRVIDDCREVLRP